MWREFEYSLIKTLKYVFEKENQWVVSEKLIFRQRIKITFINFNSTSKYSKIIIIKF